MNKILKLFKSIFSQGLSAKKLALALSIGSVLGFFPIIGTTTIISGIIAVKFRLNMVAVQFVNYLVYPLQFILIIPEIRLAHNLFFSSKELAHLNEFINRSMELNFDFLQQFGNYLLLAVIGWFIISIPAAISLYVVWYYISKLILARFVHKGNENNKK